jgi:cis-L-3-hydroxyproline dehydratase
MRIARIELYQRDLPYSGGVYRLSGGREYRSFDASFVRVVTDTGLDGWGESTPFGSTYIAAHALGSNVAPPSFERLSRMWYRLNKPAGLSAWAR